METTIELTEREVALRHACAYLKGYVVGYAVENGMKWESNREPTDAFQAGFDEGKSWMYDANRVTACHILHNRLRHDRPHTGSVSRDSSILVAYARPIQRKVAEFTGFDSLWEDEA